MPSDLAKPLPAELPKSLVEDAVRAALAEDLGRAGDITSAATIDHEHIQQSVIGYAKGCGGAAVVDRDIYAAGSG